MHPSYLVPIYLAVFALHFVVVKALLDGKENGEIEFDWREEVEERLRPHFALDHRKAIKLATVEDNIFATLLALSISHEKNRNSNWNTISMDTCYWSLRKYLNEFGKDSKQLGGKTGFARAKAVAENPLSLYRMIRRIIVILKEGLTEGCQQRQRDVFQSGIFNVIDNILQSADVTFPTEDDLNDALMGILRIHFVYGFNATADLRLGILQDVHTNITLNFDDCLELGRKALEMNSAVLAYQWLHSASLCLDANDEGMDKQEMEDASLQLELLWDELVATARLDDIHDLHLLKRTRHDVVEGNSGSSYSYEYYATCRGESDMSDVEKSKLKCHLGGSEVNPYFGIQPLKIEELHKDPPVLQFYDFISNKTIDHIRKSSYETLERSGTVSNSKTSNQYSSVRTSMSTWIYDDDSQNPSEELMKMNRRIELCTGFHVIKSGSSHALQVVNYGSLGGHYDFHDDALESDLLTKKDGDRIATFFMFLNDAPLGGYTAFPKLKIFARPVKGSAILWFSLHRNGKSDDRHTHGGCPVILGSKKAANKWILQYDNMLRYQCSLDPNQ